VTTQLTGRAYIKQDSLNGLLKLPARTMAAGWRVQSKPNLELPLAHSRAASLSASSSGTLLVSFRSRVDRNTASVTGSSATPQCVGEDHATVPKASWPCHSTIT
jgi:hypothetical protein